MSCVVIQIECEQLNGKMVGTVRAELDFCVLSWHCNWVFYHRAFVRVLQMPATIRDTRELHCAVRVQKIPFSLEATHTHTLTSSNRAPNGDDDQSISPSPHSAIKFDIFGRVEANQK